VSVCSVCRITDVVRSNSGNRGWFALSVITVVVCVYAWVGLHLLRQTLGRHLIDSGLQFACVTVVLLLLPFQEMLLGIIANAGALGKHFQLESVSQTGMVVMVSGAAVAVAVAVSVAAGRV
jgi:hypothetical protein